jgi:hypothetical protein
VLQIFGGFPAHHADITVQQNPNESLFLGVTKSVKIKNPDLVLPCTPAMRGAMVQVFPHPFPIHKKTPRIHKIVLGFVSRIRTGAVKYGARSGFEAYPPPKKKRPPAEADERVK